MYKTAFFLFCFLSSNIVYLQNFVFFLVSLSFIYVVLFFLRLNSVILFLGLFRLCLSRLCLWSWLAVKVLYRTPTPPAPGGALTELGAFMRTEFLCISVLRVASGPSVKLASCKSALNPPVVCSTDRSKAVVPVLVLLFVALWFIIRGDLLYVFPCVILFLCFSVLLVLRLPRLGKRKLILVLFVRLFGLCLFRFVGFLFLLGSGKGCGLWLWHSLDFSLTFFFILLTVLRRWSRCNLTLCWFVV